MEPRIAALADTLRLNTKLFRNCLESLSEDAATRRPSAATNSASFVAAHLAFVTIGSDYEATLCIYGAIGSCGSNPATQNYFFAQDWLTVPDIRTTPYDCDGHEVVVMTKFAPVSDFAANPPRPCRWDEPNGFCEVTL